MRVLACLDAVPAQDGTCAQTAYVEQSSWVDLMPTVEQANEVGFAMFASVAIVASMSLLLPTRSEGD